MPAVHGCGQIPKVVAFRAKKVDRRLHVTDAGRLSIGALSLSRGLALVSNRLNVARDPWAQGSILAIMSVRIGVALGLAFSLSTDGEKARMRFGINRAGYASHCRHDGLRTVG
jgi:hypothetical protein